MTVRATSSQGVVAPMPECWSRIGVSGDRSCPELETFIHCRNCPVLAEAARSFFDRPPPEGYLESWSEILEEPPVTSDPNATSVLIFTLGNEWFALPTSVLMEVTEMRPMHTIPHRSGGVLAGIVNIRGQLQLCVSLPAVLGIDTQPPEYPRENRVGEQATGSAARLLVVEKDAQRWVFAVDEVAGVHSVPRSQMRAVPSTVSHAGNRHTQALFDWQAEVVGLLDESRLIDGLREKVSA